MGYGVYDNKIRSATLPQETDDLGTIRREYRNILLQMNATPTDIRGVSQKLFKSFHHSYFFFVGIIICLFDF